MENKASSRHGVDTRAVPGGVPAEREVRDRLRHAVVRYLRIHELVPPLTLDEIETHAEQIAVTEGARQYVRFVMVLLGSAVWRETVAALPYDRRVLLLPQCLRSSTSCEAELDDFGLLCRGCGRCVLGALEREAEALGYVVLIAEGTTVVTQLLDQGRIDAVIGVSCLEALEKSFAHMAAQAVPGMAVPLIRDGCIDTDVDVDCVRELIHLRSAGCGHRLGLEEIREEVNRWFEPAELVELLGRPRGHPEALAHEWLALSGKRWRPFLTAASWQALSGGADEVPSCVRHLAVAVECFHKASLIHDDIEDDDDVRYDRPTVHAAEGIPVALNVGDLLIGEGYRLIAAAGVPQERLATVLAVASEGHRSLSVGQGEELAWRRHPGPLTVDWLLDVFRRKTAPAFDVALKLGAVCAKSQESTEPLTHFCAALGIAYQIKDDLDDFAEPSDRARVTELLCWPTIITALAFEAAEEHVQADVVAAWKRGDRDHPALRRLATHLEDPGVWSKADMLLDHYRNDAIRSLSSLCNSRLKTLLRRVVDRIVGSDARV